MFAIKGLTYVADVASDITALSTAFILICADITSLWGDGKAQIWLPFLVPESLIPW